MLEVTRLRGSYEEIGQGWGAVFKNDFQRVVEMELGIVAAFQGRDIGAVISQGMRHLPATEEFDPDFIRVLRGFAQGAGVEFEKVFSLRALLETLFHGAPQGGGAQGMCTSFALTAPATKSGETILGQNIDWHPGLPMAMLHITWPTGVQQLSLSLGGIWEYSLSGHPDSTPYGVAATLTASHKTDFEKFAAPISIVMNKASRQKRMEGALGTFMNAGQDLAAFLLANGDGDMLAVELAAGACDVAYSHRGVLLHSNHYLSERFKPVDSFAGFVPDSHLRYARLKQLVEHDHGYITREHLMRYMADHHNHPKGICSHVDPESPLPPSATVASVIMPPLEGCMYVAMGNPCETKYVRYELG